MSEEYCVFLDGKDVGTAQVEKSGLYYRMSCRCQLESGSMYNLFVSSGKKYRKLGVCIPKDGCLCLETKVPIKELGSDELQFYLQSRNQENIEKFIPVVQGEKFPLLEELENAFITERDGVLGIAFKPSRKDSIQAPQGSGRTP